MSVQKAIQFINRGLSDKELLDRINTADTRKERDDILEGENFHFTDVDFDEAFYHKLTQCQTLDEADQLKEFKMWWDLLSQIIGCDSCKGTCDGCRR